MNKLKMQTTNIVDENIKRIGELFPNCLTERLDENGRPEVAIDFDQLRQELSKDIIEGPEERYQFTWPDKRNAIRLANAPTTDTLRPCREESVDFDNTQNLYIEGDNLQVLKILRENYLGKVKMIYIDPPYNTGNDFVYNDDFRQDADEYIHNSGQEDEEGNRLVANTESNGRFHTDWLNMIYPRLKVAKDLLSEDGVIFISIGEEELDNAIKISSDIFGASNKVSIISRVAKTASNKGTFFAPSVDFIIVFAKNISLLEPFVGEVDESLYKKIENDGDMKGKKYRDDVALYQSALDPLRGCSNQRYYIEAPDGSLLLPPGVSFPHRKQDGCLVAPQNRNDKVWRWSYTSYFQNKHLLVFKETKTSPLIDQDGNQAKYNIYTKSYLDDRKSTGTLPRNIWDKFINRKGADLLKKMDIPFDFSKPVELIDYILQIVTINKDDIVLDFFSGSATTAHAVLKRNVEDGYNRRYIMVQLPESTSKDSEAFKAGYKNICEIGKERIRRAGKKILEEQKKKIDDGRETLDFSDDSNLGSKASGLKHVDVGFRVLKLDSSNMQDVYYSPEEFGENLLFGDNIKPDRTDEDLLFQAMIELGIELSAKIEKQEIAGKTVWNVAEGYLMACFDKDVNETAIKAIAKQHPYYFVLRDASLATDNVADNFEQIWEEYSKDTIRKII